jgi:hypothetical protein
MFEIPHPMYWTTSQVANIINIFSAIGTIGALIYAIYIGGKNSTKINDLAEITKQLAEQNKIISDQTMKVAQQNEIFAEQMKLQKLEMRQSVKPNFVGGGTTFGADNRIEVSLTNNGHDAVVTQVEFKDEYVDFSPKQFPIAVKHDHRINFTGVSNGKSHISESAWGISVFYTDVYGYQYEFVILGVGANTHKTGTRSID